MQAIVRVLSRVQELGKADRLIHITKQLGYSAYVNAAGGVDVYG